MVIEEPPTDAQELFDLLHDFLKDGLVKGESEIRNVTNDLWDKLQGDDKEEVQTIENMVAQKFSSVDISGQAEIATATITAESIEPAIVPQKAPANSNMRERPKKVMKKKKSKEIETKSVPTKEVFKQLPPPKCVHKRGESRSLDINVESFSIMVGGKTLLENASLKLANGRRYGLIGRNGIGKTSLLSALALCEIEKVPKYIYILYVEQEVMGDDRPVMQTLLEVDAEREELLKELNESHDDPEKYQAISEQLNLIEADTAESRAATILSGLGFSQEQMTWSTNRLSGGWRMRLALARGLFCNPDVLLLDEPTNHLDLETVVWLEGYLNEYENTVIVVSHDRDFLNNVTTDTIHFYTEKLTYYKGNYDTFERARNERLTNQKKAHGTQTAKVEHIQKFIDRFRCNAKRASMVQSRIKTLNKMEMIDEVIDDPTSVFIFPTPEQLPTPLLRIEDGAFGYTPDKKLISGININIDMESRMAILGRNGCGKTTLLKILNDEITLTEGNFFKHRRLRIANFTQHHIDQLKLSLSALEQLAEIYPTTPHETIRAHLGSFGITGNLALRPICFLSGGQKSRVAFAAVAFKQPHILFLDEPTNHLDIDAVNALIISLSTYTGGVLVISHDQHFVSAVCDEIWVIKNAKLKKYKGEFKDYRDKLTR